MNLLLLTRSHSKLVLIIFAIIDNPTVSRWNNIMRVSEGVPGGRFVELYNPKIFKDREEVIVFTQDEFNHTYKSIQEQLNSISKTNLYLDRTEEWKLIGYWPKIMEKVHILDLNIDSMFKKEPQQCYLDAYLYNATKNSQGLRKSKEKASIKL